jgi:hypothetical protein
VSLLSIVDHEDAELELDLLIREARQRQRRRRLTLAAIAVIAIGALGAAIGADSGWLSASTSSRGASASSVGGSGVRCPASPVRFVANAQFNAYVAGSGRVRLGIGNPYEKSRHLVVLYHRTAHSWAGIEAIWWLANPDVRGPITVRGVALSKQGPIEVQPSDGGLAPGTGPLTLPSDFQPAPDASAYPMVYPGSVWVRAGGCYAVDLSAHGFSEQIVFDVVMRSE